MKRITFFIGFVILFCSPIFAEVSLFNKPYSFSIIPQGGFMYGKAIEIVYRDKDSNKYLSELLWDLKPLYYAGLGISMEPASKQGFFAELSVKIGFPGKTGIMEDRDWRDINHIDRLTDFSSHTNVTNKAIFVQFNSGISYPANNFFLIRPFLSFDYMHISMKGNDGYGLYKPRPYNWDIDDRNHVPWSGTVITYSQDWFILSPGVSFGFMLDRFAIKGSFKFTPVIFCVGTDNHLTTGTLYSDYMLGRIALEPALDLSFVFTRHLSLGINGLYRFIHGARGNTASDEYKTNWPVKWSMNTAGAGLRLFESALYFKITL